MNQNSKLSTSMASVLTAINVADDYLRHVNIDNLSKIKCFTEEVQKLRMKTPVSPMRMLF